MPYGQCRTELWSWKTVKRLKQEAARIFLSIRSRHIRENWLLPQSEQTRRSTAFDFFSDDQMPVLSLRILILKTVDGSLLQRQKSFLRAKPWPFAEARMHKKLKAQFDTNISSELLWLADASCINHSALRSSSPKLRKPYGWASMSTSICWCRRSKHKKRYSKSIFVSVEPKKTSSSKRHFSLS